MSAKNEPECFACKHLGGKVNRRVCDKHRLFIPNGNGAYFICRDFEHFVYPEIGIEFTMADKSQMKAGTLYTYRFMDTVPPKEYADFEKLRS